MRLNHSFGGNEKLCFTFFRVDHSVLSTSIFPFPQLNASALVTEEFRSFTALPHTHIRRLPHIIILCEILLLLEVGIVSQRARDT